MQQPTPQWPARPGLVPALAVAAAPLQGHCDRPDGAPALHRGAVQSSRREPVDLQVKVRSTGKKQLV